MLRWLLAVYLGAATLAQGASSLVTVNTTSGQLIGTNADGGTCSVIKISTKELLIIWGPKVISFKGVVCSTHSE